MLEYNEIKTSPEVAAVIRAKHMDQFTVHGSYTDPDGTCPMGNGNPCIETWYGFRNSDCPILHIRTTWGRDPEKEYIRLNEKHKYWLCYPIEPEEK